MDLFKKCFDFKTVEEIQELGCYPYFHSLDTRQDVVVQMEGRRMIMMGSNNYMGLTSDQRVVEAGIKALQEFGSGVSGSRFLNGTLNLHIELEEELAKFLHKEACMTFSTGFQANLGIISAIADRHDLIFCDRENHASIYDGCRLSYGTMIRFRHSDMQDLEEQLKKAPEDSAKLIITDGVFSMSGDICKLPEIVSLAQKYGARVMVDDAHGLGVLGPNGRGTAEYFGLEDKVDIIMGTFSKSLASLGGYMAASRKVVEFVKHKSRPFIFCAALAPSNVACALKALQIIQSEPERSKDLLSIARYVRDGLTKRGISIRSDENITPIIPIYTYEPIRTLVACKLLFERGVYVNPVLPPATAPNECLIRTSYSATHTEALMDEAMDIIQDVLSTLPLSDEEVLRMLGAGEAVLHL